MSDTGVLVLKFLSVVSDRTLGVLSTPASMF